MGDGVWNYNNESTIKEIFDILDKPFYKKHLKKFPCSCRYKIFYKDTEKECIEIFVTFRDIESELCVDYLFSGCVNAEYESIK